MIGVHGSGAGTIADTRECPPPEAGAPEPSRPLGVRFGEPMFQPGQGSAAFRRPQDAAKTLVC